MRWTIATKYQIINISHQKLEFICASILALQKYLKRKQEINISLWTYKKCIQFLLYFCNVLILLLWISTFHVDLVVTYKLRKVARTDDITCLANHFLFFYWSLGFIISALTSIVAFYFYKALAILILLLLFLLQKRIWISNYLH